MEEEDTVYPITFNEKETFSCKHGEDLLRCAQKHNIQLPYACRGGGCGLCKVKVTSGNYQLGPSSKAVLSDEERKDNYVLACKTYPQSELNFQLIK